MERDEFRREFRRDPTRGLKSIILPDFPPPSYSGSLYNSQVDINGAQIEYFSNNGVYVRVMSPKIPLLLLEDPPSRSVGDTALNDRNSAFGADERFSVNELSPSGLELLIYALISRSKALQSTTDNGGSLRQFYPYLTYDINTSSLVGRLLASREIAPSIKEEETSFLRHFIDKERCMYCDIVVEEKRMASNPETRFLNMDEHYISFVPFTPSSPYDLRILPLKHIRRLVELSLEQIKYLGKNIYDAIKSIEIVSNSNGKIDTINVALHSAPIYSNQDLVYNNGMKELGRFYHFHTEISSGTFPAKGDSYIIYGSGWKVIPYRPKNIAEKLRQALNNQP